MRSTVEVHHALVERDIPHEFYRLARPLRRIEEAASLLGLDPLEVVAAELFTVPAPVVVLVPSDVCVPMDAVARAVGAKRARPATPGQVFEHTGFLPDWLPPVGHERVARALIDPRLLEAEVLYAAGGDPGVMLKLRSVDLVRATAATVATLAPETAERAGSDLVARAG